METTLVVFPEKFIVYMPEKFWDGQNLAICGQSWTIFGQNLAIFGQNWQFWGFLAYNFQPLLWIFLIFGMEVVHMVFFEKIILYNAGKIPMWGIIGHLAKILPFFTKIESFESFWPITSKRRYESS